MQKSGIFDKKIDAFFKHYILFCLAAYIPFYHISKTLIELLILVFIPFFIKYRGRVSLKKREIVFLGIVLFLYSISFLLPYFLIGSEKDLKHFESIFLLSVSMLVVFLILSGIEKKITAQELILSVSIGLAAGGVITFFEWWQTGFSNRVSIGTNLILAYGAVVVAAVIVVFTYLVNDDANRRLFLAVFFAIIMGLLSLVAAGAKGAALSLLVAIPSLLILYAKSNKLIFLAVSVLVIFFTIGVFHETTRSRLKQAVSDVRVYFSEREPGEKLGSQGMRLDMWRASLITISEKPLKAHGSLRLEDHFDELIKNGEASEQIGGFPHVHNDFLQAWLSRGPLGFIILVAVLFFPVLMIKEPTIRPFAVGLTLVYSLTALTNVPLLHVYSLRYFLLIAIILLSINELKKTNIQKSKEVFS